MAGNDYETIRATRQAAIQSAANVLQALSDAKRLRRPVVGAIAGSEQKKEGGKGDFLFDLLRLNARYLNELAGIGKNHTNIAQRALERLYSLVTPAGGTSSPAELRLSRARPSTAFQIHNDADPERGEVTVTLGRLDPPLLPAGVPWLVEIDRKAIKTVPFTYRRKLAFGESAVLRVTATDRFPIARSYTSELTVQLGDSTRRIPVTIDWAVDEGDGR
jgi:hypothetical protein